MMATQIRAEKMLKGSRIKNAYQILILETLYFECLKRGLIWAMYQTPNFGNLLKMEISKHSN